MRIESRRSRLIPMPIRTAGSRFFCRSNDVESAPARCSRDDSAVRCA
jgi:hypothetical protein